MDQPETTIKLVAVGDVSSLKSELLWTYVNRKHLSNQPEFDNQTVKIPNKNFTFDLWSTPNSDRVRSLLYPKTDVILLCFNVMDRNSFESLKKTYLAELKQNAPNVPILLIGTQSEGRNNEELVKSLKLKRMDPVTSKEALYLKTEHPSIINYKEPDITSKEEVDDVIITCVEHYLSTHKSKKLKGFEKWKEWFHRE